jgi:isoprenylcysteine carboxyl methyltransferase (ICMT) family protein YpbQ
MSDALKYFFPLAFAFRLGTLFLSIRHEKILKRDGAKEYGAKNSVALAIAHTIFYIALATEAFFRRAAIDSISYIGFTLYAISVLALLLVIRTLGRLWTVKLLIAKDHVLIDTPLFRAVRHPNYFLNILPELVGLSLVFHAFWTLAIGLPLYLIPLSIRIREEEAVMKRQFRDYDPM